MDDGKGGGQMEQFHRNEAISAVADEVNGAPEPGVSNPGGADGVERGDSRVSYDSQGLRGDAYNDVKGPNACISSGGSGLRVELAQVSSKLNDMAVQKSRDNNNTGLVGVGSTGQQGHGAGNAGSVENEGLMTQGVGGGNMNANGGGGSVVQAWARKGSEVFYEKASGKSKGYCQVEFYDPAAATSCKEGMNGHMFNGRPRVVSFASPFIVKKMGEAQLNWNQQMTVFSFTRGPDDFEGKPVGNNIQTGGNYQGGDNNRGYGRGNMGRGNAQGMGNRGPAGPMRNRGGGRGGRGVMGNGFGQGIGAAPPFMHPQSMMGQGFGPAFGGAMGRMGSYGCFPGSLTPPFSGIINLFPPVGGVGLPGVAPHVNPAFFGRGMAMNSMRMMPASGVDGPNMRWSDPGMGGWGGGRAGESSYREEAAFDHQHGEASHERVGWQNPTKEKDRVSEKELSGSSERRHHDDREPGYDRDMPREKDMGRGPDWSGRGHQDDREVGRERDRERSRDHNRNRDREHDRDQDQDQYREDKDKYVDHRRYRDREPEHDNDWDRGRSSKTHSKSRLQQEEEQCSRSRDADYGKRRRLNSD
ncbi:mitochondrial-processing peptidase subunit alpha-like [Hibiscus syriacus]|uniref:Mitochondrial-processing peptidase subunit alpha-like n=1 Tax=Hibiscus syriacus TaxID=106335 RepID=A0A6A3AAC8_HIBSY|nr:mitochondrial-processing peptidase subunit alpha-like [Hibiscus syriacus]